jgi:hypothetical protein
VTYVTPSHVTKVTGDRVTSNTSAVCRREQDAHKHRSGPGGGPNLRAGFEREVKKVAEKKISPRAASSKAKKSTTKAAATRVTKRLKRRAKKRA